MAALGADSGISKSKVSRICAELDETVEALRSRRLDHAESATAFRMIPVRNPPALQERCPS